MKFYYDIFPTPIFYKFKVFICSRKIVVEYILFSDPKCFQTNFAFFYDCDKEWDRELECWEYWELHERMCEKERERERDRYSPKILIKWFDWTFRTRSWTDFREEECIKLQFLKHYSLDGYESGKQHALIIWVKEAAEVKRGFFLKKSGPFPASFNLFSSFQYRW